MALQRGPGVIFLQQFAFGKDRMNLAMANLVDEKLFLAFNLNVA